MLLDEVTRHSARRLFAEVPLPLPPTDSDILHAKEGSAAGGANQVPQAEVHSGNCVLLNGPTGISWGLTHSWKALVEVRLALKAVGMGMVGQAGPEPRQQCLAHLLNKEASRYLVVPGCLAEKGGGHSLGVP